MRKFFAAVILFAAMIPSICFAIKPTDFLLGGVWLDEPYDYVIRGYGQPTSNPGGYAQLVSDVIMYGNDVEIGFLGKKVRYVVTTANNGWRTSAGVYVGMSLDEVLRIYGGNYEVQTRTPADIPEFMRESGKPYFSYKWTGTKYSWAQVSDNYMYKPGDTTYIISVVVNNNKVTGIELSQRTPEY